MKVEENGVNIKDEEGKIWEIARTYEPGRIEDKTYKRWMDKGYFGAAPDQSKKPFTIVMPPPNITGQLHMGHALDETVQDILIRYKRMLGFCTLWLPGTDHASIATEARIVAALAEEGLTKENVGREGFLERAWKWKEHYGGRIVEQLKKLGCSCDWDRLSFTMDEKLSNAVKEVFIRLYKNGLIYRGERMINWCPGCGTSISDAEVEHEEKEGSLWYIRYPLKDGSGSVTVATTRPETMLGDTAVAVNPEDERYAGMVGRTVVLPLIGREIPVIADEYVDRDFGTGAVKITPAHDPNDFEVGIRHDLPQIKVMDNRAVMNKAAAQYEGLTRYAARKKIISDLESLGLLERIESRKHNVGICYRCDSVIEPVISEQWFVRMKPLAEPALQAVREGTVSFVPERFDKIYFNWMDNIQDWCISRQLWWGHRIPAYYCGRCGHIEVAAEKPSGCSKCGAGADDLKQDEDTLDTWFSSALWPFSTLGWPEETDDLKYFYPTDVLVTAYDIIFFWVARMIFSGIEHAGEAPFRHVYIHGLVRDAQGRKMSKSLGNGIDPLEIIEKYGTDALRYALVIGNSPGNDLRFSVEKVEAGRNFANKIWNASRFVLMNFDEGLDFSGIDQNNFTTPDKWILDRLNSLIRDVSANMERYETGMALQKIYGFIWDEFCDWYIELAKPRLYDRESTGRLEAQYILNHVMKMSMKLLHPFMPFVTEEIYGFLKHDDESIMISEWPVFSEKMEYPGERGKMAAVIESIRTIRNIRIEMNVPQAKKIKAIIVSPDSGIRSVMEEGGAYLAKLANVRETDVRESSEGIPEDAVSGMAGGAQVYIPLDELLDIDKEIDRLGKELQGLSSEISRSEKILANKGFLAKAPASVVEDEKSKAASYREKYAIISERLGLLKNRGN
ncbi:MAG: valine--tRNA ligase [Eubacteriales bacterium]|nr:valine--tRNA ligase [Eubacteriales bacterium]